MGNAVDILNSLIQQRNAQQESSMDRTSESIAQIGKTIQQNREHKLKEMVYQAKLNQSPLDSLKARGQAADALLKQVELGIMTPQQAQSQMAALNQLQAQNTLTKYLTDPNALPVAQQNTASSISSAPPQSAQPQTPSSDDTIVTKQTVNAMGLPTSTTVESKSALEEKNRIDAQKGAMAQGAKDAELAGRDVIRASAAVDTAFDEHLSFAKRQKELFGTRAGDAFGIIDKLTPSQMNEFKDSFVGASREAASLVARQLIPGVRAASITKIFAESTAKMGATLEGSAENVSASMGNAFANAIAQNIEVVTEDGNTARIQDVTVDPNTNKPISQLPFQEKMKAVNDIKRGMREQMADDYLTRVIKEDPTLLKPETIKKFASGLPKFDSVMKGESTIAPGKLFVVKGEIYEAGA